jgi:hypothetical protein
MVTAHPRLAYQLFFDKQTSAAVDELDRDVRRTLRGTLRDVASPPPESFLTSQDTYIGAWDGIDEVFFFWVSRVPVPTCRLTFIFRFLPSHSSRKRRRIIGSSNIASVVSNTVSRPRPSYIRRLIFLPLQLFYSTPKRCGLLRWYLGVQFLMLSYRITSLLGNLQMTKEIIRYINPS